MWGLTTQPSFEMETCAMFGRLLSRLMAFDVKHDGLLASGSSRRSLRSVEEAFSDFDDPSSQPGNSPIGIYVEKRLATHFHCTKRRPTIKLPEPDQAYG